LLEILTPATSVQHVIGRHAMISGQFDELLRTFASGLSRRATISAALSGLFASGLLALRSDDAGAKKKRKKKKKRKNKNTQASPPPPPPPCVGSCARKACGDDGCGGSCGTCPGDKECVDGGCNCPQDAPFECPGDVCFSDSECCVTEGCFGGQECVEGICLCPGAAAINCNEVCCDGDTEVCKVEVIAGDVVASCQPGSCPPTDFCPDRETEQFVCANDPERVCVCTSTTDQIPGRVCVDFLPLVDNNPCQECDTSSDCGAGRVCISGGDGCVCGSNFCVPLCPEVTFNSAKHGTGGTPVDLEALKGGLGKRHR
jgi:hypothetical protein